MVTMVQQPSMSPAGAALKRVQGGMPACLTLCVTTSFQTFNVLLSEMRHYGLHLDGRDTSKLGRQVAGSVRRPRRPRRVPAEGKSRSPGIY